MYPLTVRVDKKRVVVIGGGKVAGFKIIPLLKQGADIVVISLELDVNLVKTCGGEENSLVSKRI